MDDNRREHETENRSCDTDSGDTCKPNAESNSYQVLNDNEASESTSVSSDDSSIADRTDSYKPEDLREQLESSNDPPILNEQRSPHSRHQLLYKLDTRIHAYLAIMIIFCCWMAWYYCHVKKQQKQWRELSNIQLAKIRERSISNQVQASDISKEVELKNDGAASKGTLQNECNENRRDSTAMGAAEEESTENQNLNISNPDIDNIEGRVEKKPIQSKNPSVDCEGVSVKTSLADASADHTTPQLSEDNNVSHTGTIGDNLASIRERQQQLHEMKMSSAKQKRRQEQKLRQRHLLESLQHDVANDAQRRRHKAMLQERQAKLLDHSDENPQRPQTLLEELQEMERNELLQQQNREYNESLQLDKERARIKALKVEQFKMRQKAINAAKCRLVRYGVQTSGLLDDFQHELLNTYSDENNNLAGDSEETNCRNDLNVPVRVRLLLPSGQKSQGVFMESHPIGLLYDFALMLLEKEKLLWSNVDEEENYNVALETEPVENDVFQSNLDAIDYASIRNDWLELFHVFSLVSRYPPVTLDEMSATLQQSGLTESVSLMVVVESE